MTELPRSAELVIVGAGVIGCSLAYHLVRRGLRPLVLEREHLAAGSSGACDGFVFLQSKKPGIHLELARRSRARFSDLAAELEFDIEFRGGGGLIVAQDQEELAAVRRLVEGLSGGGLPLELVERRRLLEMQPVLSPQVAGASFCPEEGQVNPMRLTLGFARAARRQGARFALGVEVTGFDLRGGRLLGLHTSQGYVSAPRAVLAAGAWTGLVGRLAGLEIPIRPRRGQLLVTEALDPSFLRYGMLSAGYLAAKHGKAKAGPGGQGVALEQTDAGNLLIGSTRELVGFDRRTTPQALLNLAAGAVRLVPALGRVRVIRSFAGLRPYTPDGLPLLGPVPGLEGLVLAAGHEGDGIALSPVTGELMAAWLAGEADGRQRSLLAHFRLERFAESGEGGP